MRIALRTSHFARDTAVVLAAVAGMAGTIVSAIDFGRDIPALIALPLLALAVVFAGYVFLLACCGSRPAMLAFLAVLAFVNDGLFRVRDPGDIGLDWQNALKFALWAGALVIGICRLPQSRPLLSGGAYALIFAYIGYAVLSSIYSASPMYSLGTAIGLAGMPLFGAALVATLGEKEILLTFALSLLVFILLGWVAYFALPELGRSLFVTFDGSVVERICGLAGQANALGNVLAVYLALIFLLFYRRHLGIWICAPMAGIGVFTLFVADSRTALLAFVAGAVAVVLRRSVWRWGLAFMAGLAAALFGMSVPLRELMSMSGGLSRSGDPTELFTLTGRTEIWQFAWDKIVLSPWIGYGYNSSKFILPEFDGLPGLKIDEAHNMLLQNLLAVGWLGTAPLIGFFVYLLGEFLRRPDAGRDLLTFMALIWGITVAGAFGSTPTVMTLEFFIVLTLAGRRALLPTARRSARASVVAQTPSLVPSGLAVAKTP